MRALVAALLRWFRSRPAVRPVAWRPPRARLEFQRLEGRELLSTTAVVFGQQTINYVLGLDSQVWFNSAGSPLGPWNGYQVLPGGGQVKAISAALRSASVADLFAIGLNDQVYVKSVGSDGNPLMSADWTLVTPGQVKAISAVSDQDGTNSHVFAIGLDDMVYVTNVAFSSSGFVASPYAPVSPGGVEGISAAAGTISTSGARVNYLFAIGLDGQVWEDDVTIPSGGPMSATGYSLTYGGQVQSISATFIPREQIISHGQDFVAVHAIGLDGQMWGDRKAVSPGVFPLSWAGYNLTAPGQIKSGNVVVYGVQTPAEQQYVIGLDDQVWELRYDQNNNPYYLLTSPGQVR